MNEQKQIKVLIVDDHPIVHVGMESMFSSIPDIHVVGQATDSRYALLLCAKYQPDVILMDLVMGESNGIEATRLIRGQFPSIQVIIFTTFQEQDMVQQALQAGAISYLLKDASTQEIVNAVRTAASGKTTLSPGVLNALIHSIAHPPTVKAYDLTERELEVLLLMAEGMTNPQIASKLVVSVNTIRHHVRNILIKLGVPTRLAAVRLAIDEHLVPSRSEQHSSLHSERNLK